MHVDQDSPAYQVCTLEGRGEVFMNYETLGEICLVELVYSTKI